MLIYISTLEKANIIEDVCQEKNILVLKGIVKKNFDFFLYSNLQSEFENVDYIVIEIDSLVTNSEEEIINGIKKLKMFHKMKIIVICNIEEDKNQKIISRLINELKIYNIITKTEDKEINKELKNLIMNNAEYKNISFLNIQEQKNIGVLGIKSGIGTTTQSIAITKFINFTTNSEQACYIERNQSEVFEDLKKYYNLKEENNSITYKNVDMYKNKPRGYKYNIFDFGNIMQVQNINEFFKCDIKIIISGSKAWQMNDLFKTFEILEKVDKKEIYFIINATPEEEYKKIKKAMGKYKTNTYFSKEIKNPFSESLDNKEIYKEIFNSLEIQEGKNEIINKKWRRKIGKI